MSVLCRFGFHDWVMIDREHVGIDGDGFGYSVTDRVCLRCRKRDNSIARYHQRLAHQEERKRKARAIANA